MGWIANFFNQLPRFNFAFREIDVSNGFNNDYLQSVVVWSCIPLLLCLVLLTAVFIVWSTKCCIPKVSSKRRKGFPATPRCLTFLIILSCLCAAVSLVANEMMNRGAQRISEISSYLGRRSFSSMENVRNINETLFLAVKDDLQRLKTNLQNLRTIQKSYLGADTLILRINEVESAAVNASFTLESVSSAVRDFSHLKSFGNTLDRYEFERWILVGSLLTIILTVMLSSITVLCLRSKRGTVLFGAIGIFMFILAWSVVGGAAAFNLVLADFCTHPVSFLIQNLRLSLSKIQLEFYAKCNDTTPFDSPLHSQLKFVESSLEQAPIIINGISCLLAQNAAENSSSIVGILTLCESVQSKFYDLLKSFGRLEDAVGCRSAEFERESLRESLCVLSTYGAFILLLACTIFGFLLFFVLLFLNRAWRSFEDISENGTSTELYERDQFLVNAEQSSIPADFYGSHVSNPRTRPAPSENASNLGVQQNNRGDGSPIWRSTPPPAYESVPLLRAQVRQQRM